MSAKGFEELRVYQLSEQLADKVWDIVNAWGFLAQDTVGKQLIRASDGVGATIAEGVGRWTFADNRRFARMARGSMYETRHWLRRAYARGLLTTESVNELKPLVDELLPKLNAYIRSLNKRWQASDQTPIDRPSRHPK